MSPTRSPQPQPSRRRKAFTLLEVLAVLSIVLVLLALLVPLVSLARRSAQRTTCASNLSQCGRALFSYANENKGYVPRGCALALDGPPWAAVVARELGIRRPFDWSDVVQMPSLHCPAHPTTDIVSSYVINAFLDAEVSTPAGLTKLVALRAPSTNPLLLETPPLFNRMSFFPFDDIYAEEARFVCGPEHLVGGARCRLGTSNHGSGSSNVLFADGHVEVRDNATLRVADFVPPR